MKNDKPIKVYRLALYGLSSAGKTCLLAALAMPRYPHQLGYTCTWQPVDVSALQSDDVDDQQIDHQRGKRWLEEAINRISQQKIPDSNPLDDNYFVLEYDFTNSSHQTFRIELVDYSGDLLALATSDTRLARHLRKKFMEMDGILVIVEAPFLNGAEDGQVDKKSDDGQSHLDLYQLRQAFSLLRDVKQEGVVLDVPVALMVSKWDRYSDIDYVNPNKEQYKLEDFLNSNPLPPHKGLHDVLRSSVTEENFKLFPVSALGVCESTQLENGKIVECPKQVKPLNAFGLEDAFVWLVGRRDAIDLQHFQQRSTKFFWKCHQVGLELLARFLPESEQAKQIETTLEQCQKSIIHRWMGIGLAVVITLLMLETTMDAMGYRQLMVTINNPESSHAELEEAEEWLFDYITAPYVQHLVSSVFLSRDKAQKTLIALQEHREDFLWESVTTALKVNLQDAQLPVSSYLQYYPAGSHVQEAQDIKLRAEQEKNRQENEAAFSKVVSYIQEYQQDVDKLSQVLGELRGLPKHPQEEGEEIRRQRLALIGQTSSQVAQLVSKREWNTFYGDFGRKMQTGNFLAAALLLTNHQTDIRLDKLKETFKTAVIKSIEQKVKQAIKNGHFGNVDNLFKEYAILPLEFQTQEGQLKVVGLQRSIYQIQDETLYEAAQKHRDKKHIFSYLHEAPIQTMAKEVSAYKVYLNRTDPNTNTELDKLQLKLSQIRWKDVKDDDNVVNVFLNGKQVIYNENVKAEPNTATEVIGISKPFTAKLNDSIGIKITIVNVDMMFDDDYGSGTVRKPISELINGYNLPLENADGVITGSAYFEIEGYPKAPPLPEWRMVNSE